MDEKEKERVVKWRQTTGLSYIKSPEEDVIQTALKNSGVGFSSLAPKDQDEVLAVLSSWYFFLSAEMGRIYANVVATSNATERAKLNILKPAVEALKVKIETLKKIYDRRIRELTSKKAE